MIITCCDDFKDFIKRLVSVKIFLYLHARSVPGKITVPQRLLCNCVTGAILQPPRRITITRLVI